MPNYITNPRNDGYHFTAGRLFLGQDEHGDEIGIATERHAITIAGAGAGKGAGIISPNLIRWPDNALVVDPKGEAVEITLEKRLALGKTVRVIDPFHSAQIDPAYRASYNPLAELDPDSLTIKEDITAVADGIIMRHDSKDAFWNDGAQTLLAGVIGYVLMADDIPASDKNLITVRQIIGDENRLLESAVKMETMTGCGNVCKAAFSKLSKEREREHFISGAQANTEWLDSAAMVNSLAKSDFSLRDLKTGNTDVFLVLPPEYVSQHGRFLRLFVRCAINAMAKKLGDGQLRGQQCLFLLDEFFTLGYIDEIAKAAGLMRGYGLQLWPILQDIGQLRTLYGRDGAETFFGNSDAHIFFGNNDNETLEYISKGFGTFTMDELDVPEPVMKQAFIPSIWDELRDEFAPGRVGSIIENERANWQAQEENAWRRHQANLQLATANHGKQRLPADTAREIIAKKDGPVAEKMIVFAKGSDRLIIKPAPYFLAPEYLRAKEREKELQQREQARAFIETRYADFGNLEDTPLNELPLSHCDCWPFIENQLPQKQRDRIKEVIREWNTNPCETMEEAYAKVDHYNDLWHERYGIGFQARWDKYPVPVLRVSNLMKVARTSRHYSSLQERIIGGFADMKDDIKERLFRRSA